MLFRVKKHEDNNRVSLENGSIEIMATQMSIGGFYYKPKVGELVRCVKVGTEWLIVNVALNKESDEGDITLFNDNIEIQIKNEGNVVINISGNAEINASQFDVNGDVNINGNLDVTGTIDSAIKVEAPLIKGDAVLGGTVGTTGGARGPAVDLEQLSIEHKALEAKHDAHVITYTAHTHTDSMGGSTTPPK